MLPLLIAPPVTPLDIPNARVAFTGIPSLGGARGARFVSHSARVSIGPQAQTTQTTSVFRNGPVASNALLTIPFRLIGRVGGMAVAINWNGRPLPIGDYGRVRVSLRPNATYSLRTMVSNPVGRGGDDPDKRRLVAYDLTTGELSPEILNIAFSLRPELAFDLPTASPSSLDWKVSANGAFARSKGASRNRRAQIATLTYYVQE